MTSTLYVNNVMVLTLSGLKDSDGNAVTDATVQLIALVDRGGDTPSGVTLPLTMAHVGSGAYEATISEALDVQNGDVLTGTIKATSGAQIGEWQETVLVRKREG